MAEIVVHIAPGMPRLGIWCDGCLTSAGYEVDAYILGDDGPRLIKTISGCTRCDDDE